LLVFITPQVIRSAEDVDAQMQRALEERMRDHKSSVAKERQVIFGG
jgi:type II secretory pathway component GspD/PulD (secretin)